MGRHPLLFLVVPMVTSTIISAGMFQVAVKNILSYTRIYSNYFHALQDLINVLWHSVVSATLHTLVVHSMTMLLQTLTLDQAVKESLEAPTSPY